MACSRCSPNSFYLAYHNIYKSQVCYLILQLEKLNLRVFKYLSACMLSCFSRGRLFATPGTVARLDPPSMGISRLEYWSGSPFPSPGNLPYSGIQPVSLTSPALPGRFFTTRASWESHTSVSTMQLLSIDVQVFTFYSNSS